MARAGYRKAMLQLPSISGLGAQSWRTLYVHWPVWPTALGAASLAHFKSQLVLEPLQLSEQEPVQVTWHVEPPLLEMLPLGLPR